MNEKISSLTPEQAQRAVLTFFDLLPAELWQDRTKPSVARLETLADRMDENAPEEIRSALKVLRGEEDVECKGEVAKIILESFWQQDALRPYVEQALAKMAEPHMVIDPISIGIIITVLAVLSSKYHKKTTDKNGRTSELSLEGGAPKLIEAFTGFVKALPKKLLEKLA
jgi:hypothetical protein